MTKEIPILDSCDVLVCGGGFGGISAALAAARLGKRVILLEKQKENRNLRGEYIQRQIRGE